MKIYDSLSKKKIPITETKISIYNCGPTVYNDIHIGNARPLIVFDVLHRYLKNRNVEVNFVHNITDIDDKIINRAIQTKENESVVANRYFEAYLKVLEQLNILPLITPKVSDNMEAIIDTIRTIVKNGYGYVVDGDVYFDIQKIENYGEVSHQKIEELLKGVRKKNNPNKKYPLDFTLWKKTVIGKNWDSPWSRGRPGWHTECVTLINEFIGNQVTIHGGGIDLRFPHHENENAQSIAINNCNIAKIWMHIGHINFDNQKMSKSLNNFILVKDILKKYSANTLRWFMYQTQYQSPLNYKNEMIDNSKTEIEKIIKNVRSGLCHLYLNNQEITEINFENISEKFMFALNDNFNLPNAITSLHEKNKLVRSSINGKSIDILKNVLEQVINELTILGIQFDIIIDEETKKKINEWKKAVANKNFSLADKIREEISL